jgi:hypothetical protein
MAFFKKLKQSFGGEDEELMKSGLLGRATVLDLSISGTTVQVRNAPVERVCTFRLQVMLDDTPPFEATTKKRIPEIVLPQFQAGQTVVAVRVDPNDHSRVGLDLGTEPPTVRMAAQTGQGSKAEILASGTPCTSVIVEFQPLGMKDPAGVDMYAFLLTVMPDGVPPYQVKVGFAVPPAGVPLLFPGSKLPAKYLKGTAPENVVVDWDAALANPT